MTAAAAWPPRPSLVSLVDLGLIGAAATAWAVAVAATDVDRVGDLGLVAVVHPLYVVAPVLCVVGFAAELLRGARRPAVLGAYLVLVILIIHATAPALLDAPRFASVYRYAGMADLIAARGTLPPEFAGRWPAFPAGLALFATVSGVDPLALAPWAPVLLNLVASVLLFAIARALTDDRRPAWLTVLLFQCVNWTGPDRLTPHGLAFLLYLAMMLVVVRWLRVPRPARGRPLAWLHVGLPPADPRRAGPVAAGVALAVLALGLAATHPLAPLLAAGSVVVLAALGLIRPWWTAAVVLAVSLLYLALYLAPRLDAVRGSSLLDGFDLFHAAGVDGGSPGQAVTAVTVRTLALVVWFLALLAAFRDRRSIGRVLTPLTLAFVPFALVLAPGPDGDAIHHVYQYSAPWCAFLIADMACQSRWPRAVRAPLAVLVMTAMLFAAVQGREGQLLVDRQRPSEVVAARYLYTHGRPGAAVVLAAPNFPARAVGTYDRFNVGLTRDPDLVTGAGLAGVMLGEAYLPLVERFVRSLPGSTRYLVISDGMRRYAAYVGALPDGSLDRLDDALHASPQWTTFYRDADVVIYELDASR